MPGWMDGRVRCMRLWGRLFNAASPQFIQRLGPAKTNNEIILLFDFFNRFPGLRRFITCIMMMYVKGCPGYVRTNMFIHRCKLCGVPGSEHPPVDFKKRTSICLLKSEFATANLSRTFYRLFRHAFLPLRRKLIPALEHMKQSWRYITLD